MNASSAVAETYNDVDDVDDDDDVDDTIPEVGWKQQQQQQQQHKRKQDDEESPPPPFSVFVAIRYSCLSAYLPGQMKTKLFNFPCFFFLT